MTHSDESEQTDVEVGEAEAIDEEAVPSRIRQQQGVEDVNE